MSEPTSVDSQRHGAVISLLITIMLATTYQHGALSVLSKHVIEDLQITRAQLGMTFSLFPLVGAVSSPWMGAITDRRQSAVLTGMFLVSASGLLTVSLTQGVPGLVLAAFLGGVALAAANPVTNSIMSQQIPAVRRGGVFGLKQAGPQIGILVAGIALPPLAEVVGWRGAVAAGLLLPATGFISVRRRSLRPLVQIPIPAADPNRDARSRKIGSTVKWLTLLGMGVAMGNSAIIGFLPLYAQEGVGMSPTMAGWVASLMGLVGVTARIIWGIHSRRFAKASSVLLAMSGSSVLAITAIAAAEPLGAPLLWLGAAAAGVSLLAWHVVAWLVVLDDAHPEAIGRTSGIMQGGIALGFAAGAPVAGALIDATGSYPLVWTLTAGVFAAVTGVTWIVRWDSEHNTGTHPHALPSQ